MLLVVIYHAGFDTLSGGYIGVDVFFVISGYLITGLLLRELETTGTVALAKFYGRRIRRLLPAATLVLVCTIAIAWTVYSPLELKQFASSAFATATYLSNIWFAHLATDYLAEDTAANPLLHTWSLSAEEQFYLAWPLLLLVTARLGPTQSVRRRLFVTMGILAGLSLLASLLLTRYSQPWAFFGSPTRAWEFALGGVVALWNPTSQYRRSNTRPLLGALGITLVFLPAIAFDRQTAFPGFAAIVPVVGALLIISAAHRSQPAGVNRWISSKPMQFVGNISYSLYLWHWPIFVFMPFFIDDVALGDRMIGIALAFVLAWVTYVLIENPFRFSQPLSRRVRASIAVGLLLSGSSASFALVVREISASSLRTDIQKRYFQASRDTPRIYAGDCHAKYFQVETPECTFGVETSDVSVVLFGDSHAAQWFPALEQLSNQHGWRLTSWTKTGCASVHFDQTETKLGRPYTECTEWRAKTIERIKAEKPTLLIIANSNRHVPGNKNLSDEQRKQIWADAVGKTLSEFEDLPTRIIIIRDTPWPSFNAPTCLSRAAWQGKDPSQHCIFSTSDFLPDPIYEAEHWQLSLRRKGHLVDMTKVICPDTICTVDRDGIVVYHDAHHLTASFSRHVADALFARLRTALPRTR